MTFIPTNWWNKQAGFTPIAVHFSNDDYFRFSFTIFNFGFILRI